MKGFAISGPAMELHAATDSQGALFRFSLTPENIADITEPCQLAE